MKLRHASCSFTASRVLSDRARNGVVTSVLQVRVPHVDRYVTGACVGGDAFIGQWLFWNRPDAEHMVVVPANRSRVDDWWVSASFTSGRPVTVIEMPPSTSPYADRNARLVAEADCVFGFPAYTEQDPRSVRSGTWQTIRMARRVGNFSQWHLVNPPFQGWIERYPADLLGQLREEIPHGPDPQ